MIASLRFECKYFNYSWYKFLEMTFLLCFYLTVANGLNTNSLRIFQRRNVFYPKHKSHSSSNNFQIRSYCLGRFARISWTSIFWLKEKWFLGRRLRQMESRELQDPFQWWIQPRLCTFRHLSCHSSMCLEARSENRYNTGRRR